MTARVNCCMKIAIDISQIVYEGTGVARYTRELVRHLVRLDKNVQYLLFAGTWRKQDVLERYVKEFAGMNHVSIKILPLPQSLGTFLWNRLHIVPLERCIGPFDLLHSSDWIQPPTHAKKVTTIHDLVIMKYAETSHPTIVSNQERRLRWVRQECDGIITDSQATSQDVIDYLHVPKEKLHVAYPGIDPIYQSSTKHDISCVETEYNLSSRYILSVGTQEPRKNIQRLLAAYVRLRENIPVGATIPELVLVGNQGWAEKVHADAGIRMLGFVPDADLPALYSSAMAFVYPSLYEGFGFPVLEAMAAGCPVLASDRGSLKEVVGDAAVLIDPEDTEDISNKLLQITHDEEVRKELMKKGKAQAARFTWEKTAQSVLEVYKSL